MTKKKVFISHSSKDKPAARKIKKALEERGVLVWLDEKDIKLGSPILDSIEHGLNDSNFCIALISDNSIRSEWVKLELRMALNKEIANRNVFILPIRLGNCQVPTFLSTKKYITLNKNHSNFKSILQSVFETVLIREIKEDISSQDLSIFTDEELIEKISQSGLGGRVSIIKEAVERKSPKFVHPFLSNMGLDVVLHYSHRSDDTKEVIDNYIDLVVNNITDISSVFCAGLLLSNSDKGTPLYDLDFDILSKLVLRINDEFISRFSSTLISVAPKEKLIEIFMDALNYPISEISSGVIIRLISKLKNFDIEMPNKLEDLRIRALNSEIINGRFIDFTKELNDQFEYLYEQVMDSELMKVQIIPNQEMQALMNVGIAFFPSEGKSEKEIKEEMEKWENLKSLESCQHRLWMNNRLKKDFRQISDTFTLEERVNAYNEYFGKKYYLNFFDKMKAGENNA